MFRADTAKQPVRRSWFRRWLRLTGRYGLTLALVVTSILVVYRFVPPPVTPLMLIRLVQGRGIDKTWVPLDAISPDLARALIASEDNLFCSHWGLDIEALKEQLAMLSAGGRPRGASTITQQTAKNILLWPGRDPLRKVIEAVLAPEIELVWNKRRIMEVYLNVIELGPGLYGAEAASRHYFNKSAAALTLAEATSLAAIVPSPLNWSPIVRTKFLAQRARVIRERIWQLGPMLDCVAPVR